jgi:Thioesterase-like superfamily
VARSSRCKRLGYRRGTSSPVNFPPVNAEDARAYFIPTDGGLQPVPEARSPWSADMLHGRLLAGLVARAVEAESPDDAYRLTRLTLDMFRSPPMTPFTLATDVVRAGRRVRVVAVSITCDGIEVARARVLSLRSGPHPSGAIWHPREWDVPAPATLPPPDDVASSGGWDLRLITPGGFWTSEQKQLWCRDTWDLVAGEAMSPLVRAALAADLPNPMANASADGLQFINADLSLFLARAPESEWIGLEVSGHVGDGGIAVGSCNLYDTAGAIGYSTVCAVANEALDTT